MHAKDSNSTTDYTIKNKFFSNSFLYITISTIIKFMKKLNRYADRKIFFS